MSHNSSREAFCYRQGWEFAVGCGVGPVFLVPDLLSSFVVAVVTVQRSSVPSLVSPCVCPQVFPIGIRPWGW